MSLLASPNELSLVEAALAYAVRGWPVFPILPKGKLPLAQHGLKDSSLDPLQIKRWWAEHPAANIGLDCGAAQLVVIDVNVRERGLRAWERLNPGPPTLTSHTGGGGSHVFYRAPQSALITNSAGRIAPGIDVRATGGYVVLPPSRHESGNLYLWSHWRAVAELPAELFRLLTDAAQPSPVAAAGSLPVEPRPLPPPAPSRPWVPGQAELDAETASVRESPIGECNRELYRAAFNLGRMVSDGALTQAQVEASLTAAARDAGLPEEEIRRTLASGLQAGRAMSRQAPAERQKAKDPDIPAKPKSKDAPSPVVPRRPSIQYAVQHGHLVSKALTPNGFVTRQLCNFDAQLNSVLITDDGEIEKRQYTLVGRTDFGKALPEARVDALEFDRLNWIKQYWAPDAIIHSGNGARDHLGTAIQYLSLHKFTLRHVYTHTGWRQLENAWGFLSNGGVLSAQAPSGDSRVAIELQGEIERYHLPQPPADPEALRDAMRSSLRFLEIAPPQVTIPLWAAMFLAPTTSIYPPRFALWLYGVTGSLKSTLAALALSHFGDWTANDLIGWNATANALGKLLFLAKDVPFIIDDFAPQSDRFAAGKLEAVAASVVRDTGNHTGRVRMNSDRSLAAIYRPRGLLISTGEQLPDNQSLLARLIAVEMRLSDVKLDLLGHAQAHKGKYAEAMAGYIVWLAGQYDTLPKTIRLEAKTYRDQLRSLGQHLRIPDQLGALYTGFISGLRYAEAIGALTAEQADTWRSEGWRVIVALGRHQAEIVAEERPVLRFLIILRELLNAGRLRLDPLRGSTGDGAPASEQMIGSAGGNRIGYFDAEYIYILPTLTYNHVAKFLKDEGRYLPIKEYALKKALVEEGILEMDGDHYATKVYVQAEYQRLYRLNRTAVEKLWEAP